MLKSPCLYPVIIKEPESSTGYFIFDGFSIFDSDLRVLSFFSNSYNCFRKPGFGFIMWRPLLIKAKALGKFIPYSSIRYAAMQEEDQEIPAQLKKLKS